MDYLLLIGFDSFAFIIPLFILFNIITFLIKVGLNKTSIKYPLIALIWPTPLLLIVKHFSDKNNGDDKGLGGLPDFFAEIFLYALI